MPTHFPSGVSNVRKGSALFQYGMLDPTRYVTVADDFFNLSTVWTVTEDNSGTAAADDGLGGVVTLDNSAGNGDVVGIITNDVFALDRTKPLFFKVRFSVDDVNLTAITAGFQDTNGDGIYFSKAATDTALSIVTESTTPAANQTAELPFDLLDGAMAEVAFAYDPVARTVIVSTGDSTVVTVRDVVLPATATVAHAMFEIGNGSAAGRESDVDYIVAASGR